MFEHALEHTAGDDLARLLWLKSPSSEVWFERRTNYTRSLAVMSMVGYILGLGKYGVETEQNTLTSGSASLFTHKSCFKTIKPHFLSCFFFR